LLHVVFYKKNAKRLVIFAAMINKKRQKMKRLSGITIGKAILLLLGLVLFPSVLLANVDWMVSGRVVSPMQLPIVTLDDGGGNHIPVFVNASSKIIMNDAVNILM
jgi:hypothetical protein